MTQLLNIKFVAPDLTTKDYLLDTSLQALIASKKPESAIDVLVLPSSVALPFKIELPFSNNEKIAKVLPQFVADIYSIVDEKWLFCWEKSKLSVPEEDNWQIYGLTFPPEFTPSNFYQTSQCRLAVADAFLSELSPNTLVWLKTPVDEVQLVTQATNGAIRKVLPPNCGLDNKTMSLSLGVTGSEELNFELQPDYLKQKILYFLANPSRLDMSQWHKKRKEKLAVGALLFFAISLIGIIAVHYFFIWIKCLNTEGAARRTREHVARAFSQAFPGLPTVEPISQTQKKISEIRDLLASRSKVPDVPLNRLLALLAASGTPNIRFTKLSAQDAGFRVWGVAKKYSEVEQLRKDFETSAYIASLNIPELRQVGNSVNFALEGKWGP